MKKLFLVAAVLLAANLSRAQWEPDVRLTNGLYGSYTSLSNAWCIAASGNSVHIVWYDERDGNNEIYYKRSTDAGVSWGADIRLTNNPADKWDPSVAIDGSVVHVTWMDARDGGEYEIYYKRSTDGGISWEEDTRLTNASSDAESPSLAVSGSVLHVVWYDYRDQPGEYEIYYKRSTDGGASWEPDTRLTNDEAYSGLPSVAVSGSVVHVLWEDDRDGDGEIYYKRSTDGGASWGSETRITNSSGDSWDPSVAVDGMAVHITWMDDRDGGEYEIYYKRSDDGGITWGDDTRLTNAPDGSEYPNIAASGSVVHIVWQDLRDGDYEIYYKKSTDGGLNWGEDLRLTNAIFTSQQPSVAVSDSVLHVVWYDDREMNEEIYYKRNPTGNIVVGIENDLSGNSEQQLSIYPNPVSDHFTITFKLENSANVKLEILNRLGQIVTTILDESFSKGTHQATWNTVGLPSGIYFYRMTAGNHSSSGKLVVK